MTVVSLPEQSPTLRALEVIDFIAEIGCAVERALSGGQFGQIAGFLDRRQALLEDLLALTREGVRLDDDEVRPRWQRLLAQDQATQANMTAALARVGKELNKVRRKLSTTAAYGERAPRVRASTVDLRG